jgi:aldehyde dehydrogenase (NAD+)
MKTVDILASLGLDRAALAAGDIVSRSPIDGAELGRVAADAPAAIDGKIARAEAAFRRWRLVPAPRRGEFVRLYGNRLRKHKEALGRLVTLETGKILQEGLGEVQEMIDICDFALGLSRQLYGLTIATERPNHRMMETWHPLGPVGVISAFNFPVAVWSWNAALAFVCGDSVVWKPSEKTPLSAVACLRLFEDTRREFGTDAPDGLLELVQGGREAGQRLADDRRLPLISATGSTAMGKALAPRVAARLGRALLELGGNNAMVVCPSADLDLAVRAILFAAVGTAGQRCTSLRRLIVHESVADALLPRLKKAYDGIRVGDPLESRTLIGPLIDKRAFDAMQAALASARAEGGRVSGGERVLAERHQDAYYVRPAIVEMPRQTETMRRETFAPILYVVTYKDFDEAVALHNAVPQGLASCIFTTDLREAEAFMAAAGSDCGIVNVNIGPSGAEIGGAFGGEKETGGGRESGSDSWKAYMRRATNTINYGRDLPLAQGIVFDAG